SGEGSQAVSPERRHMQINTQIFKSVKANANAGREILVIVAMVSGIATGKMMYLGSEDDSWIIRWAKVALGLGLIEGGLAFAYHGIRKVFTNSLQRGIAWACLFALVAAVLCNLFTERMLAPGISLEPFQQAWVDWAFDGVVVVVMLAIGAVLVKNHLLTGSQSKGAAVNNKAAHQASDA